MNKGRAVSAAVCKPEKDLGRWVLCPREHAFSIILDGIHRVSKTLVPTAITGDPSWIQTVSSCSDDTGNKVMGRDFFLLSSHHTLRRLMFVTSSSGSSVRNQPSTSRLLP